jgi:hypothetical protein
MKKAHAHRLLDQLDTDQFDAVSRLLEIMVDPAFRAAAPSDDEPVTEQDRRRFHEGQPWFANRGGKSQRAPIDPTALQRLIEQLGPEQIDAVARLLEVMIDPEDEPMSDEDRRAVAASREYFQQNPRQTVSFEELAAECGFTIDQIRHHQD